MLLRADAVTREFAVGDRMVPAVKDVTLDVAAGEMVALTGPSGSGKTTLLGILGLLDTPTLGRVLLDGRDVTATPAKERARLRLTRLGFVFQNYSLHPAMTAAENVALPLVAAGTHPDDARAEAATLLDLVGLTHRTAHHPSELSGGEQQRVAVARALANRPAVVLADEPTGNLDRQSGALVMDALRDANERLDVAVLLVTHDPDTIPATARRVRMVDGRLA